MLKPILLLLPALLFWAFNQRLVALILAVSGLSRIATEPLCVHVTATQITIRWLLGSRSYSLRDVQDVTFCDVKSAFGSTTPAVRLKFDRRPIMEFSGFLTERTDDLYKSIKAAWQAARADNKCNHSL